MKLQLVIVLCLLGVYAECKYNPENAEHGEKHRYGEPHGKNHHYRNGQYEVSTSTDFPEPPDHNKRYKHEPGEPHGKKHHYRDGLNEGSKYATDLLDPPDHKKLVEMARYVMHNSDWVSVATISVLPAISGFPFSNVKSIADGPKSNSTGIPYFYMSPMDFTAKDLMKNNKASILASLQETGYCVKQKYDPEDPRCTRLMLSGKMKKVKVGSPEYTFAKAALFERHPDFVNYPADHDWFVAKLKIAQIAMVDWFGGAKYVPVKDYLAFNYTQFENRKENTNVVPSVVKCHTD